mmetsp:Transcript_256/g.363  ORF Transcript_256/g.363 Transcript_256/m.363 type:complete len:163 (-) Transcript_256:7-495(-)
MLRQKQDPGTSAYLILVSSDKLELKILRRYGCRMSKYIDSQSTGKDKLECPASSKMIRLIVEYITHHEGKSPDPIQKPLRGFKMNKNVPSDWDAQWIDEIGSHRMNLFRLAKAAENMGIRSLIDLACAKIACLVKGCKNRDVKRILDVKIKDGTVPEAAPNK